MFILYDGTIHNHDTLRPVLNTICYKVNRHNNVIEPNYYILVNILVHKGKYDSYVLRSLKTGKTVFAKKIAVFNDDNK